MIRDILLSFFVLMSYNVLREVISKSPEVKFLDTGEKEYVCPVCGQQCSYWYLLSDQEDKNIIFEIKCHKYCEECGTKLNYKKVNEKHEKILRRGENNGNFQ